MDNSVRFGFVSILLILFLPFLSFGQSFEARPVPDIWFNSIDGVRLGVQLNGASITDFGEDRHRLNLGIWYGSKNPSDPVSYYFSFTEEIPWISSYDKEANIELISSVRTGLSKHGFLFTKRFQPAFQENNHSKLTIGFSYENQYDTRYIPFDIFQQSPKSLILLGYEQYNTNKAGPFRFKNWFMYNANSSSGTFRSLQSEVNQLVRLSSSFKLNARGFLGLISSLNAPEHAFSLSFKPVAEFNNSGLSRARGTIPQSWYEIGNIHVGGTGGANLRGYVDQSLQRLNAFPIQATTTSIAAVNLDLDFPNPINNKIQATSVLKDVAQFRSYVFFDAGLPGDVRDLSNLTLTTNPPATPFPDEAIFDGGVGFTVDINIPDFQGNRRGFVLRYEMPFWVSSPLVGEESLKFRQVIGFGGIFTF